LHTHTHTHTIHTPPPYLLSPYHLPSLLALCLAVPCHASLQRRRAEEEAEVLLTPPPCCAPTCHATCTPTPRLAHIACLLPLYLLHCLLLPGTCHAAGHAAYTPACTRTRACACHLPPAWRDLPTAPHPATCTPSSCLSYALSAGVRRTSGWQAGRAWPGVNRRGKRLEDHRRLCYCRLQAFNAS